MEGLVRDLARPPTGPNVNWDKLAVLARPNPSAVSGIPTRFGFDPRTRRFALVYSTDRAAGGRFGAGALTRVAMPRTAYPTGYHATVWGATIASPADAPTLVLAAAAGAREVGLAVSP